jgi:hypothetical protein
MPSAGRVSLKLFFTAYLLKCSWGIIPTTAELSNAVRAKADAP